MKARLVPFFALGLVSLLACAGEGSKPALIHVGIEEGDAYKVQTSFFEVERGSDLSFRVFLEEGAVIESVGYDSYELSPFYQGCLVTLKNVLYPTLVSLKVGFSGVTIHPGEGRFIDNDGPTLTLPKYGTRKRENAPIGTRYLKKEGYAQIGWNDEPDLGGNYYGFGWRYDSDITDLYPVFVKEDELPSSAYEEIGTDIAITSYINDADRCVLPSQIEGKEVTSLVADSVHLPNATTLVLPSSLKEVAKGAINAPKLENLYFYDGLEGIFDDSLDAPQLEKAYINAVIDPRCVGTYWDVFQDKLDFLIEHKDDKKIVIFGGSSCRYGFDSPLIEEAFPDYTVVNMGYFAYINAFPQLEIVKNYLNPGDVLLHTPEFDASFRQFFLLHEFEDRFFYSLEAGYGALTSINLQRVGKLFSSFSAFQAFRKELPPLSYRVSPLYGDDDGNFHEYRTYNENGDMTLPREPTQEHGRIGQAEFEYSVHNVFEYNSTYDMVGSANAVYHELEGMGVRVLFSYAPKNIDCLSKSSTKEVRAELERYIQDNIEIPVISSLEESLYTADHFYLIDNHLTKEGAKERTLQIIEDLRPYLV